MANDHINKAGQSAIDKASEFARSVGQQVEEKAEEAQELLEQGQKRIVKYAKVVDKQIHKNPWPVVIGVAVVSFLLGKASRR